jgi:hypothetical protein
MGAEMACGLVPTGLDQLWVADITYVRLLEKFAYVTVLLDAFSRRVIGWALDKRLRASEAPINAVPALAALAFTSAFAAIQGAHHRQVPIQRGRYQRCGAGGRPGVHVGLRGEQGLHHLRVALLRGDHQRRRAIGQ